MRWLKYTLILLLILASFWMVGFMWFVTLIPAQPANDKLTTDAIVVLTGGSLRLDRGFELMAQGRASKMFISGVEDGVTLASLLRGKDYKAFAEQIPAGNIALGHKAHSTVGNAEETAQWVAHEQVKSLRLVTGSYHIPRSVFELGQTMTNVRIVPEPVFPSHFAGNRWWQSPSSIRLVISEYHKFVASILVHRLLESAW